MTTGVVIVANRSDKIDYPAIALWNARRVVWYLGLPVTIITDANINPRTNINVIQHTTQSNNKRYFTDVNDTVSWNNSRRYSVYELSPYDTTILIDADYIVSSDALFSLTLSNADFQCFRQSYSVTGDTNFDNLQHFGDLKIPMAWATVLVFKKGEVAKTIFEYMAMVENNYAHYAELYKFAPTPYRNDYALSIALLLAYGQTASTAEWAIPWALPATSPDHQVELITQGAFRVCWTEYDGKQKHITVSNTDLHVMGKRYLEKMMYD